jgi:outer membrane protein
MSILVRKAEVVLVLYAVCLFLFWAKVSEAGNVQYYDKFGNIVTEEEYIEITKHRSKKLSPQKEKPMATDKKKTKIEGQSFEEIESTPIDRIDNRPSKDFESQLPSQGDSQQVEPIEARQKAKETEPQIVQNKVEDKTPPISSKHIIKKRGKFGVGAHTSYILFSGDSINLYGIDVDVEADDAFGIGIDLTYFFSDIFSLKLNFDYAESDVDFSVDDASATIGRLTQFPILLTGRFHIPNDTIASPYFGGGVGYYFNNFDSESDVAGFIYGSNDIDLDDSFGFHANCGLDLFLSENHSFNIDLKYVWSETDASVSTEGFTNEKMSLDSYVLSGGYNYLF